ncbi:hypothetical protein [Ruficoccus sp. ZRK36]|uniref:hypothetical protein n=1 Tax=Ruficoccus sp. ZRK36 TaxID=2866311 RepID=UPI001C73001A|nr:hypothetical protein [Ruficoccus sp. ZRK36]QYY35290.1 hypothetical protein K0V07_13435 [Ruficoccus sp. ZRK36]
MSEMPENLRQALEALADGTCRTPSSAAPKYKVPAGELAATLHAAGTNAAHPERDKIRAYLARLDTADELAEIDDFSPIEPRTRCADYEASLTKTNLVLTPRGVARLVELAPEILKTKKVEAAFSTAHVVIALRAGDDFALTENKGQLKGSLGALKKIAPLGTYTLVPAPDGSPWQVYLKSDAHD